jgi:hypothetical protein
MRGRVANMGHLSQHDATLPATSADARHLTASFVKRFARVLCIAKQLLHQFLKQAGDLSAVAADSVCALGVGADPLILRGAVTFRRPTGRCA